MDDRALLIQPEIVRGWRYRLPVKTAVVLFASLFTLMACSSSGGGSNSVDADEVADTTDDPAGEPADDPATGPEVNATDDPDDTSVSPPEGVRLVTRRTDRLADGVIDEVLTYAYDPNGRILTKSYTTGAFTRTISHEYEDGRLTSRTDGFYTESFSYEGDRTVGAILRVDGPVSYLYDDAGNLAGVVGKGLGLGEGDCGEMTSGGGESSYDFEYRSDGKLESATQAVTGLEVRVERRPDGRIKQLLRRACDGTTTAIVVDYDVAGRARGFTNEFPGRGDRVVTDRRFDGDNVSAVALAETAGDATRQVVVTYSYDEQGLRVRERTRIDGEDELLVTYEYEAVGCVPQLSADPSSALAAEFVALFFDPGEALGCGYWFDDQPPLL